MARTSGGPHTLGATPVRALPVVVFLALMTLVTGCGIHSDDKPRELPSSDVPFGLLDQAIPPTTAVSPGRSPAASASGPVGIYLVDNDARLVEVADEVAAPGGVRQAIEALFGDLSPEQLSRGLNTSIDSGTRLLDVTGPNANGLVVLDVSRDLSTTIGERLRLALAQIIYTATSVPGVRAVQFKIEGEPSDVPDGSGASTSRPLTRNDFIQFAPQPTP